jgi:hypothetical protein
MSQKGDQGPWGPQMLSYVGPQHHVSPGMIHGDIGHAVPGLDPPNFSLDLRKHIWEEALEVQGQPRKQQWARLCQDRASGHCCLSRATTTLSSLILTSLLPPLGLHALFTKE